jgi:hypothetical protein
VTLAENRFCVHFTGLLKSKRCDAGVDYETVKQPGKGHGVRIPCISKYEGTITCALRQFPTPEQEAKEEQAIAEYLSRLAKVMRGELRECLECGKPVDAYREVRPCVYAEPCGHRQWQGKAPKS